MADWDDDDIRDIIEARPTRVAQLLYRYLYAQATNPINKGYSNEVTFGIAATDAMRLYLMLYALDEGAG